MKRKFILINLNQKESDQSRTARIREIMRWSVLTILIGLLFGGNVSIWYIGMNYNNLLNSKERDIKQIKYEISKLLEKGKNLSKQDIMTLAKLENNRFMWAECFQRLGNMTPDDMSITGLKFKRNKLIIKGIASTYKGKKKFEQIENFVHALKADKIFSNQFMNLKLKNHEILTVRGQEIVSFEIEAPLKSTSSIQNILRKPVRVSSSKTDFSMNTKTNYDES